MTSACLRLNECVCCDFVLSLYVDLLSFLRRWLILKYMERKIIGSLFLTQSSGSGNVVSLEENYGDKVVKSDKYSDISEDEGEELDKRLR